MQGFRDLLKGWFGKVLLTIFILPFAFFGIQGLFQAGGRSDASIVVDGEEITNAQIERSIEQQRQNLAQRMGGGIDPSVLSSDLLRPGVEETLIQKSLLKTAIGQEGLYLPQEKVSSYVRAMPMFQDEVTGEFSQVKLERVLVQVGYSGTRFFEEISQSLLIEQLQKGVSATAFVTPKELEALVVLDGQKRNVATVTLSSKSYEDKIELSDEDIQTYYTAQSDQYQTQEKVKVSFVNITADHFLSDDIEIAEADIRERFDGEIEALKKKERRRASHILVEINDDQSEEQALVKIKDAKAKLEGGQEFDAVAQELSEDIATSKAGGDLGFSARGIYDASFDDALFALEEAQVSDIVRTEFGYHLIKLVGVETPDLPEFSTESMRISKELKADRAEEELTVAVDELNRLAFESGDLSAISEKFNITVQTSGWIQKAGGPGLFADRALAAAAFAESVLQDQNNSEVIETEKNGLVVLRLEEHEVARTLDLNEVRGRVVAALKKEKSIEKAKSDASAIVKSIDEGKPSNDIESEYAVEWKVTDAVARQNSELDRAVVSKIFELPKPEGDKKTTSSVQLSNGDWVVVVLSGVSDGEYTLSDKEASQMGSVIAGRFGQTDFQGYLGTLKDNAQITRN